MAGFADVFRRFFLHFSDDPPSPVFRCFSIVFLRFLCFPDDLHHFPRRRVFSDVSRRFPILFPLFPLIVGKNDGEFVSDVLPVVTENPYAKA